MTRAQRVADALAEAHKAAHPEPQEAPNAEQVEAAGVAALRRAIYGDSPTDPPTEVE